MIMTPAILASMRPIFSRQARTGTRQHRNRINHKFRYRRPKKKIKERGVDRSSAWNIQPVYNAIVENFDRALTDITWARVPARNCLEGAVCFANMTHALNNRR